MKLAAVVAVAPMVMGASQPVHLQPTSKWVVDYADDSCRLIRTFGTADEPAILLMEKVAPDSAMSMLVVSKQLRTTMGARDFTARFLPHEHVKALFGQAAAVEGKEKKAAVLWSSVSFDETYGPDDVLPEKIEQAIAKAKARMAKGEPMTLVPRGPAQLRADQLEELTRAAKVTAIEITRRGSKPLVLDTGSMGTVVQMMKSCARNQLAHWGIDPSLEDKIVKPVRPIDPMGWFSARDYPTQSLRDLQESQIKVRALVDAKGSITKCTPVTRVAAVEFPLKVCEVMQKRARFDPAELADGTKVPSYYIQPISFRMKD